METVESARRALRTLAGGSVVALAILAVTANTAGGQAAESHAIKERQSLDDAWWTGPMLANSAATLPRGHFLIEPYLYDVSTRSAYDAGGSRRSASPSQGFGSLTYILYGLTDRVSLGVIPTAGYNTVRGGPNASGVGLGDVGLLAQYGLTRFHQGSWIPATAIAVQETFPTGKFDRLGDRPSDGMGGGAYSTTLSLYSQMYFWLPTGRVFRMRGNVSQAFSGDVVVEDVSVYGTQAGFRGRAKPGSSSFFDVSSEYSVTRSWVLALDVTYRHARSTQVTGFDSLNADRLGSPRSVVLTSSPSDAFGLAPAVEYSWTSNVGVLVGVRLITAGRNTAATVTPAVAINIVR